MPSFQTFNLVLVGENLPITRVRTEDLSFPDFEITEKLRVPVAFQLAAGPYTVTAMPERYEVGVAGVEPSEHVISVLKDNGERLADLAGRRSIRGIGHNFQAQVTSEGFDAAALRGQLIHDSLLASRLGLALQPDFELAVRFDAGDASAVTLKLTAPPTRDRLVLDFNFHFDLDKNLKTPRPMNAIERFGESLATGMTVLNELCAALETEEART